MYDPFSETIWFYWPVTFALVAAMNLRHLARRRAFQSAALGLAAVVLPLVPRIPTMRIRCHEDGQSLDSLFGYGLLQGVSLFAFIAWLAVLAGLRVRAGDERAAADRTALWSAGVLFVGVPIEGVLSFSAMEGYCLGLDRWPAVHLAVAATVLLAGIATGAMRQAGAS